MSNPETAPDRPTASDSEKTPKPALAPDRLTVTATSKSGWACTVQILSWVGLVMAAIATVVLWEISESTWWGTVFTFVPRSPLLLPPALLLVLACFAHRRSIWVNLAALAMVAGPLMGGRIPLRIPWEEGTSKSRIEIVSCNVQHYEPDFELVLREISALHPDVVALQEAPADSGLARRYFAGWNSVHGDEYWVWSRFPIRRLGSCKSAIFHRETILSVQIDGPDGPFVLHDLHLTTCRFGLEKLSLSSVQDGSGPPELDQYTRLRLAEAREAREYVDRIGSAMPVLVVGDFNTPTCSQLYRTAWAGFTNAFDEAGFGFGFTAPCGEHHRWFNHIPWVRIDHILADERWSVLASGVGVGDGSDHRLIQAHLSRR